MERGITGKRYLSFLLLAIISEPLWLRSKSGSDGRYTVDISLGMRQELALDEV